MNLFDKPLTFLSDLFSNEKKNKDVGMLECILNSIEIKNEYLNEFNWKKYLEAYPDIILEESNEMNAYKHWIEAGKFENRCAVKIESDEAYDRFEYESYLKVNPDLASVLNGEFELYHHWSNHGRYENRLVTSVESIKTCQTLDFFGANCVDVIQRLNGRVMSDRSTILAEVDMRSKKHRTVYVRDVATLYGERPRDDRIWC